ncbi:hypothetical protein HFO56_00405 [Rhizobium laguerreae]|uniref:hypothetical protein n=1 Tax=Rhizobium laguerreae TaxID=1076926 RepID=UPI001C91F7AE|nr:hypothetical protein [Rhizobium laguerreae]MBY3150889.1 hypothetical protein [Rhizobium laguerreae]
MVIIPGSTVMNVAGKRSKLGPLILSEGVWYGFVPAHSFKDDKRVVQSGSDLLVGEVVPQSVLRTGDRFPPITESLRLMRFYSYAPVKVGKDVRVRCVDPLDVFPDGILLKNDAMAKTACKIVSLDGPFAMNTSDGVKTYSGAFGIKADGIGVVLATEGDGGASIVTRRGDLVGVLIGVAADTFFCVPGNELMARFFPSFDNLEMVA